MSLQSSAFRFLRRRLAAQDLPIRIVLPSGASLDCGGEPHVTLRFQSRRALNRLLRGDVDGLAECYVEGDLAVDGSLHEIIATGAVLADRLSRAAPRLLGLARGLAAIGPLLRRRHTRGSDARAIQYHYDVSNEFYALWLDRNMVYSCGYFHDAGDGIDAAQEQKLDHICRKLRLAAGERLLDIGCGWGGLLLWAARHYGVSGVGVTLSKQQCDYARRRVAAAGLSDRIEIRLQDYRDIGEREGFDKIASVGMFEHVGRANLPTYFAKIRRLLKPGGLLMNHGITAGGTRNAHLGNGLGDFMERYIFPGGELTHVSHALSVMADEGLEMVDTENLRPHYARTLWAWSDNLESRLAHAREVVSEQVLRAYRLYLAGCAMCFERGWIALHQVLAVHPTGKTEGGPMRGAQSAYPFNRGYIYR